jgi:MFS transporter, AAHS family, 4-hydroxybenzoate transporter
MVCVPVGGTVAALIASEVLPRFGWTALFAIGGVTPLAVGLILIAVLPESPRYLAREPARWPDLARLLRRAGYDVSPEATFVEGHQGASRASLGALLAPEFRRDTIALWASFALCLLAIYLGVNWIPSMLTGAGLDVGVASTGLAAFNLGGVVGALIAASVTRRIGSRPTMLAAAIGALAGAFVMSAMPIGPGSRRMPIVLMLGFTGGLINTVQIALYALATHVYPTAIRATGVGAALAIGRLGAVASSYLGAWTLATGGSRMLFIAIGLAMTLVTALLAVIRKHIPVTR